MKWWETYYEPLTERYFKAPRYKAIEAVGIINLMLKSRNGTNSINDILSHFDLPEVDASAAFDLAKLDHVGIGRPEAGKAAGYRYYPIAYYDKKGRKLG